MTEILKIGKAQYEVNAGAKTYRYYGRSPEKVSKEEQVMNRRRLFGYSRILRDKRKKIFRYT